jgi:pterin-4a-carbinolamine dehydratase
METVKVFVSYRRDSDLLRAMLVDAVVRNHFRHADGPEVEIYRDTRQRVGQQWPDEIERALREAHVVLVLIGPGWLQAADSFGRPRLEKPDDWVRREVLLALDSGATVIPIVFETSLPEAEALPEELRRLRSWRAALVRDSSFDHDMEPVLLEIARKASATGMSVQPASGDADRLPYPQPPMKVPPAPMSDEELELVVTEVLPEWALVTGADRRTPGGVELFRPYRFRSFPDAIAFMSGAADFADNVNHHPRWENVFRTVYVYLTTWDLGHKVSHLDVTLAGFLDRQYDQYLRSTAVIRPR